jgi:hypothetical protein
MFRAGGPAGAARFEEWATDAAAWGVTREGENLKMFAAQAVRTISRAGRELFSSEHAVGMAAEYKAGEVNVSLNADRPTRIRLFLGSAPVATRFDGVKAPAGGLNFNRADGTVTFSVKPGERRLSFSLR